METDLSSEDFDALVRDAMLWRSQDAMGLSNQWRNMETALLSDDTKRLNWLHSELKVTIAYALNWGTIPQDQISFRAALDKEMAKKPPRVFPARSFCELRCQQVCPHPNDCRDMARGR